MKLKELLTEMPQSIGPLDQQLIDNAINDCLQNINSAIVVETIGKFGTMYEFTDKGYSYYFIYNSESNGTDRIEYFVRFHAIDFDASLSPRKAIRQVLLWRNKSSMYSVDVAKHVFWDLLFPQFKCLASDSQQTSSGKFFWTSAVGSALKKGLTVRIINTNDKTFIDVTSIEEFAKYVPTTWGTKSWFQRMIIVIFE